jgi:hypothetical protein
MSDSSLSPPPVDPEDDTQELPALPLQYRPLRASLPNSGSPIFSKGLFSRLILDTIPAKVQFTCLQDACSYAPSQPLSNQTTSNLWKHLENVHPLVHAKHQKLQLSGSNTRSSSPSVATFFKPQRIPTNATNTAKFRELLLSFIVSNNLPLRLPDSQSFKLLVNHLNPTIQTVGRMTLRRDLQRIFSINKARLVAELQQHVLNGGRISLTTDAWSARNYSEYAAVTAHWISDKWQLKSTVLDVVHLLEPIHSGEYLAEQMINVTDDYHITPAIFTCTRDNASANTAMLLEYEKLACKHEPSLQQPWSFTVKEGDVRCLGHIINLAVQAALTALKAVPADEPEAYRLEYGAARMPVLPDNETVAVLDKLRRHIYVLRNRRQWKDMLKKQCEAANIQAQQLSLDMPVRWNSTFYMIDIAIKLRGPITAICASQQLDLSMKDIALTATDWQMLDDLWAFFNIFIRPTQKLQGSSYPTLSFAVVQYMRINEKLAPTRL